LTFETATRLIHVAAGFAGLVLGPIAMGALKRAGLHTRVTAFLVNNFQRITGIAGIPFAVRALVPMFFGTCAVIWAGYQVHVGKWPTSPGGPHKL
jgi:hypothetical protein